MPSTASGGGSSDGFIRSVEGIFESITDFSKELWGSMVDQVTVNSKDNIVFTQTGGMEIKA